MNATVRTWLFIAAILAATVAFYAAVAGWADHRCERAGGHNVSVYKGWICVSDDGRVIEP